MAYWYTASGTTVCHNLSTDYIRNLKNVHCFDLLQGFIQRKFLVKCQHRNTQVFIKVFIFKIKTITKVN